MARHRQLAWRLNTSGAILAVISFWPPVDAGAQPLTLKPARHFESAAEALEPVRWVLAQATAPAGETADRATAQATQSSVPSVPGILRLILQDNAEGLRLAPAPLRWGGNVGTELRLSRTLGSRRSTVIEYADARVATFLGQPWLAQLSGHLGVVASQHRERGHPLDGTFRENSDRSVGLTGGFLLSVFPQSRFPFTASFENSDSRTSGVVTSSDYTNRVLALRQRYRSALGDQNYSVDFERSAIISEDFGRDTVTSLSGSMQRRFPNQQLDVAGNYAWNRRSASADGSDLARISAQHSYRPAETATLDSMASFTFSDFVSARGPGSRNQFLQLTSLGTWRPDEEERLFLTGSVRYTDATLEGRGVSTDASRMLGLNVAASYALTEEASVFASGGLAWQQAASSDSLHSNQTVGATYSPGPLSWQGISYAWGVGASASNQTGGVDGRQNTASAQAQHNVTRNFELGPRAAFNLGLGQSLGYQYDSVRNAVQTLTHTASAGLQLRPNDASNAFLALSLGDSRSRGGRDEDFQLVNLQASGQVQLAPTSSVTANLTVQGVRQRRSEPQLFLDGGPLPMPEASPDFRIQRSGSVAYQQVRLFRIPRLRLHLSATFNDMELDSRLLGDVSAPRETVSQLYEGRLEYNIGKLEVRLGTRFATIDGRDDRQVFLRVNRQLGFY